ncbi:hypothetical protein VaNZ11_014676 [Volvox africanus]|uniref:Uncharacterized protein n=1 Tax=Volvox africanus TaxID=51714 RepID=A0ABQ5SJY9_9CHLO|nr:hypothetical protein VaNZ11_014676 [Volvox africanus]
MCIASRMMHIMKQNSHHQHQHHYHTITVLASRWCKTYCRARTHIYICVECSACCNATDGLSKLVINSFKWLADAKTTNRETIRLAAPASMKSWSSPALANVAQILQASSSNVTVTADNNANLTAIAAGNWSNVDVLCLDTYTTYTPAQIDGLIAFANQQGKGLLVAGHAWYWGYSHPDANIFTDLSINRILWPLGLVVTTNAQSRPQAPPASLPNPAWPYYNAHYVLDPLGEAVALDQDLGATRPTPTAATRRSNGQRKARGGASSGVRGTGGAGPSSDPARNRKRGGAPSSAAAQRSDPNAKRTRTDDTYMPKWNCNRSEFERRKLANVCLRCAENHSTKDCPLMPPFVPQPK